MMVTRPVFWLLSTLLVLFSRPSHQQQGQDYYYSNGQPPSFLNGYQQQFQQNYRPTPEPLPQRSFDYRRPLTFDQDIKTSDLQAQFQRIPQFQYQRPLGFNFPQVSTPAPAEAYSFQDQRFGHFPAPLPPQPVTPRPQVYFQQFNPPAASAPPRQLPQQQFQQPFTPAPVIGSRVPAAPPRRVKEPPRQVQLSARFPTPVQSDVAPNLLVDQSIETQPPPREGTVRKVVRTNADRGRIRATTEADTVDAELAPTSGVRGNRLGLTPTRTRTAVRRERPIGQREPFAGFQNIQTAENSQFQFPRRPVEENRVRRPTKAEANFNSQFLPEVTYEHKIITTTTNIATTLKTTPAPTFTSFVTPPSRMPNLRVPFEEDEPTTKRSVTESPPKNVSEPQHLREDAHGGIYPSLSTEEDAPHHQSEEEESTVPESSAEESEEVVSAELPPSTMAPTTHQQQAPAPAEPTESWVIVASVQTSRSVSGARFLPAGIVNQKVWNETRSGDSGEDDSSAEDNNDTVTDAPEMLPNTTVTISSPSTESIIDKLDRVQSELSSGIFSGGFRNAQLEVLTVMPMPEKTADIVPDGDTEEEVVTKLPTSTTTVTPSVPVTTTSTTTTTISPSTTTAHEDSDDQEDDAEPQFVRKFSPAPKRGTTPKPKKTSLLDNIQFDDLTGLLPPGFKPRAKKLTTTARPNDFEEKPAPTRKTTGFKPKSKRPDISGRSTGSTGDQNRIVFQDDDISGLLPPGYKPENNNVSHETTTTKPKSSLQGLLSKIKFEDPSSLLPAGYQNKENQTKTDEKPKGKSKVSSLLAGIKFEEPASLLPPGYKPKDGENSKDKTENLPTELLSKIKFEDASALLPPGYKPPSSNSSSKSIESLLVKSQTDDVSSLGLLPPGFKLNQTSSAASSDKIATKHIEALLSKVKPADPSSLLPPGFKAAKLGKTNESITVATTAPGKIVLFPGKPGVGTRKPFGRQTTEKPSVPMLPEIPKIQKGWPIRVTTVFTGWPTPPTTPISIEKLLEQARLVTSTESSSSSTVTSTTTTTTTTTTTPAPTTPGVCSEDCELAGTVKIVDGVRWVPELVDSNTREWQDLANEVEHQLDDIFKKSPVLSGAYKKIRIDSFSKGSVLVDYFVELKNTERITTRDMKKLFHETLSELSFDETASPLENRTAESMENIDTKLLKLGKFVVDPKYTDFVVVQRQIFPTVGYAEEENLLPQWAIAVIVIGLASLLFVVIFGVTVMVNRHKNNQKRNPTPLTEDIINEMNKSHLGGLDNFGADDLYGMDDVWNDKGYDRSAKKRSHGSFPDNSMTNLYDSWRSDWNGYNSNYGYGYSGYGGSNGGHYGGSHYGVSGGGRKRSDYDTNF